jgi:hypothetical protein
MSKRNPFFVVFLDGNWADWSEWSSCSVTSGEGNQTRLRTCTNPVPSNGGSNCSATNVEYATQACNNPPNPGGKYERIFTSNKNVRL